MNKVNVEVLLAFLECLNYSDIKALQMANYISALKSFAVRFDTSTAPFEHPKIHMYLKAIQKPTPFKITLHNIVDIPFLHEIITKCKSTYLGQIFKAMYLLAFFGFLRLSNMAPHSVATFSHLKHLAKVMFSLTQM